MEQNNFTFHYIGRDYETEREQTIKLIKNPSLLVVGIVLNLCDFNHFKKTKNIYSRHSAFYGYSSSTVWNGAVVCTKKHQRGVRMFYDLHKLGEYLNGTH